MAKITVTEAARLAGVGRQQLYRGYINTGKISVERDHNGRPQIDTAEILRVFGELRATSEATISGHDETIEKRHLDNGIKALIEAKDEMIAELRARLQEAADRESWLRQQLERAQAVLTDQRQQNQPWWKFW